MIQVSTGQAYFYRFDVGQRESIRRIISTAKSMLSRNAISRAGEGLPSSADSFRHAKIVAMTPRVRLRPSSTSFSIGVLRKNLRQSRETTVYYVSSGGRIVEATVKAIVDRTDGVRFQGSFGDETALTYLWQIAKDPH
jgi:hypothetical protein